MLISAVSVLVVAQSRSEIPEGLMNNPLYSKLGGYQKQNGHLDKKINLLPLTGFEPLTIHPIAKSLTG